MSNLDKYGIYYVMKKLFIIICLFFCTKVYATNIVVESLVDFDSDKKSTLFQAKILESAVYSGYLTLRENAILEGEIIEKVEAKRGKRGGYIVIHPTKINDNGRIIPINDNFLEAKIVGYSKIDWKQTGKKAGLTAGLTVGGHFVPGLPQIFYFSKGVITPKEGETRLKSGAKSVYENSLFVYIEKGEEFSTKKGDLLVLKLYRVENNNQDSHSP